MPETRKSFALSRQERLNRIENAPQNAPKSNYDAQKADRTKSMDKSYWKNMNQFYDLCKEADRRSELSKIVQNYESAENILEFATEKEIDHFSAGWLRDIQHPRKQEFKLGWEA